MNGKKFGFYTIIVIGLSLLGGLVAQYGESAIIFLNKTAERFSGFIATLPVFLQGSILTFILVIAFGCLYWACRIILIDIMRG